MGLCAKFELAENRATCYRLLDLDEVPNKRRFDGCDAGVGRQGGAPLDLRRLGNSLTLF